MMPSQKWKNLQQVLQENAEELRDINMPTMALLKPESRGFTMLLLVEEMAELTQEIIKYVVRGKEGRERSYYEELADVIILIDAIVNQDTGGPMLSEAIKFKVGRYVERYGKGRK
jgi:NTP pyrophosphatase (non-canonical NTP hydrolase)